jgi:hypothetical protein
MRSFFGTLVALALFVVSLAAPALAEPTSAPAPASTATPYVPLQAVVVLPGVWETVGEVKYVNDNVSTMEIASEANGLKGMLFIQNGVDISVQSTARDFERSITEMTENIGFTVVDTYDLSLKGGGSAALLAYGRARTIMMMRSVPGHADTMVGGAVIGDENIDTDLALSLLISAVDGVVIPE